MLCDVPQFREPMAENFIVLEAMALLSIPLKIHVKENIVKNTSDKQTFGNIESSYIAVLESFRKNQHSFARCS